MALWTLAEITTLRWFDTAAMSQADNTAITSYTDFSGNADHAVQATSTKQPKFRTNVLNGLPVARFDGGDVLEFGEMFDSGASSGAIFVVFKNAVTAAGVLLSTRQQSISNGWTLRSTNSQATYFHTGTEHQIFVTVPSTFCVLELVRAGTSIDFGVDGTSTNYTFIDFVASGYNKTAIGAEQSGALNFLNGDIAEIAILPAAPDIDTLQKIRGRLHWKWGLQARLPAGHPYKDAPPTIVDPTFLYRDLSQPYIILTGDPLNAASEHPYGIATDLEEVALSQLYSMLMETWIAQHYGDVPVLGRSLIQPYRGAPVLNKSLDQRWADALQIEHSLLQEWSMPGPLEASSEQRYGICAEVLNLTCEQLYNINERTTLFAGLIQPYALAGEAARLYQFDIKLYLDGLRIPYHSLEWQAVDSESAWSCDFAVKSQAVALRCVDGAGITIVSPWDTWQLKVAGGWSEDKRHGSTLYRVRGYSRTRDLDQALPLLGDLPAGMASQLVADLAVPHGISVDWQMADGYLAAGKVTANNQTPLAVIKEIVHDARGIVLSTMEGNLLIVAEEEIPIPDWPTVTPADTIIARLERISTSSQPDEQRGFNRFKVSDQLASGDGFRWDTVPIDARTKEARLFVVPFDPLRRFALTHSGGTNVSIEPFGLRSLQVKAEQVEFVAGSSKTRLPIYGDVSYTWRQADLGLVSHAEDGLLTAATPGESLLSISYRTQYYRWIVRDPHVEDVQIIFNEVPA